MFSLIFLRHLQSVYPASRRFSSRPLLREVVVFLPVNVGTGLILLIMQAGTLSRAEFAITPGVSLYVLDPALFRVKNGCFPWGQLPAHHALMDPFLLMNLSIHRFPCQAGTSVRKSRSHKRNCYYDTNSFHFKASFWSLLPMTNAWEVLSTRGSIFM
jgi:hypothetical protein